MDAVSRVAETEALCWICGERLLGAPAPERICLECTRQTPPFRRAIAFGNYEGRLRELIHLLKYEGMRAVASILGGYLAEAAKPLMAEMDDTPLVVPVPLHQSKQRQRGFNQSELIARAMVRKLGEQHWEVDGGALERRRATGSQMGLSRAQRRVNLRGAFYASHPDRIAGRNIPVSYTHLTLPTTPYV